MCAVAFSLRGDTVAKKREDDEEDREGHALVDSSLRFDAIIHHHVPVLAGQDLIHTHTHRQRQRRLYSCTWSDLMNYV